MNFLRNNWFDLGGFLLIVVTTYIFINHDSLTDYQTLMWLILVSLFLHQVEEYRVAGTFPGMVNKVMYESKMPDRFPLNTNSAFFMNVVVGWTFYFLAAIFAERAIWLGMATIIVSMGNIVAHTFVFNIKGKTFYNAGLVPSLLLSVPCCYFFFSIIHTNQIASMSDYGIGLVLGIGLNFIGILKLIDWIPDENTTYIFNDRYLLPKDRKKFRH